MSFPSFSFDVSDQIQPNARERRASPPREPRSKTPERKRRRDPSPRRESRDRKEKKDRSKGEERRRRRDSDSDERDRSHHDKRRRQSRDREERSPRRRTSRDARRGNNPKVDFLVDRKADPYNLMYGSAHKSAVPLFRRAGDGLVLGAADHLRFPFNEKPGLPSQASLGTKKASSAVRRFAPLKEALREPPLKMAAKDAKGRGVGLDFVALDFDPEPGVSALEALSEQQQAAFNSESAALARKLEQDDRNYGTWKALLDLQDSLVANSTGKSNATRLAVAEKKLAICEKAFKSLPAHADLWLDYLRIGTIVWDTATLLTKWDQALATVRMAVKLWLEYISFRQTNATTFTVSDCLDVYGRFLQLPRPANEPQARELVSAKIYVFTRACLMLKESGYIERALAAIQAMLELAFRWPSGFSRVRWSEAMSSFEEYFEGPLPKFGEEGSQGWAAFAADRGAENLDPDAASRKEEDVDEGDETDSGVWWENERAAEEKSWMPQHTVETTQDPNAVVVMDDVRPLLFAVETREQQMELVVNCLRFFGLPLAVGTLASHELQYDDAFLTNAMGDRGLEPRGAGGRLCDPRVISSFPQTVDYLFSRDSVFGVLGEHVFQGRFLRLRGAVAFVRNILLQVLETTDGFLADTVAAVLLGLEFCASPKRGNKLAKQLLKRQRNNLALWYAFSSAERAFGSADDARHILLSSIQLGRSTPNVSEDDLSCFYYSLLELEMAADRPKTATTVLIYLALKKAIDGPHVLDAEPSPPQVLKARKLLAQEASEVLLKLEKTHYLVSPGTLAHAVRVIAMRAWLEYFAEGYEQARLAFDGAIEALTASSRISTSMGELVYQEYLRLVSFHAEQSFASRTSDLARVVESAVKLFPRNTAFLELYFSTGAGPAGTTRSRLSLEIELQRTTPTFFLSSFPAIAELNSPSSNANVARTLLNSCLDKPHCRSSSALWIALIRLELSQGRAAEAKQIIWTALRECPWSKDLYAMPFNPQFGLHFTKAELEELWTMMADEKEMRVRCHWEPEERESESEEEEDSEEMSDSDEPM